MAVGKNDKVVLKIHQVQKKTTLTKSAIYRLMGALEFPRNFKISKRSTGWLESEIDEWIDQRAGSRELEAKG